MALDVTDIVSKGAERLAPTLTHPFGMARGGKIGAWGSRKFEVQY